MDESSLAMAQDRVSSIVLKSPIETITPISRLRRSQYENKAEGPCEAMNVFSVKIGGSQPSPSRFVNQPPYLVWHTRSAPGEAEENNQSILHITYLLF